VTIEGIDISHYQQRTPPLGATLGFVFARATYGTNVDDCFAMHVKNVTQAGKIAGAYHFGRNGSPDAQAAAFLKTIGPVRLVALDLERDGTNPRMTNDQAARFIQLIHATGRKVGLYASQSGYPHVGQDWSWVASWDQAPTIPWDFWQYASGSMPHTGGVDRDRFKGTLEQLQALAGMRAVWQWRNSPGIFQQFFDVNAAAHTYGRMDRRLTAGRHAYDCTPPVMFTGPAGARRVVRLGHLVNGAVGPRTGQYVGAGRASRRLIP
jgi:hypothetical protein